MEKIKKEKRDISSLVKRTGEKQSFFLLGILLSVIGTLVQLVPFLSIYHVMSELLHHLATKEVFNAALMIHWAVYGLIGLLIGLLCTYLGGMLCHTFAYRTICTLRLKLLEHIGCLPLGYVKNNSVGKTRQILETDTDQLETYLSHQMPDLISTVTMLLVLFIGMFYLNVWLALAALLPIVIGFAAMAADLVKLMKSGAVQQNFNALERINSSAMQYVKGMPTIKIFGQTVKSFRSFYDDIMGYRDFALKMTELIRPSYVRFRLFILSVATFVTPAALLLWLKNPQDSSLAASILFFFILGPAVSVPLLKLRNFAESNNVINESVSRIYALLDESVLVETEGNRIPLGADVCFDHVRFSYSKEGGNVLDDISFVAKQGEITALVGPSGAGKSTIAELIPRFWDVQSGRISFGGVNIRDMKTQTLMENMSFVFQSSFLFDDTVYNNIAMGKVNATKEEVEAAAKAAQCHDFILHLPEGYHTKMGNDGTFLSGGEKQRIAIARAILKNAPLLIMDEATSSADAENEYKLQQAMSELIKNKTVIVIAHRLKTIQNANQILVIKSGKIVESGTHEELLVKQGLYNEMWKNSLSSATWQIASGKEALCHE